MFRRIFQAKQGRHVHQLRVGTSINSRHYLPPPVKSRARVTCPLRQFVRIFNCLTAMVRAGMGFVLCLPGDCAQRTMEPTRAETVAPGTVASLRGGGRSTPVWWEAFDDEGSWRGRILRNPRSRPCRVGGVSQMSVRATPGALSLVPLDGARRDLVSHSFAFFTGLCEKRPCCSTFACALNWASQTIVVQKDWNDCACAL
jgi:hypothetical protein